MMLTNTVIVLTVIVLGTQFVNSSNLKHNVEYRHGLSAVDRNLLEQLVARVETLETKVLEQKQELNKGKASVESLETKVLEQKQELDQVKSALAKVTLCPNAQKQTNLGDGSLIGDGVSNQGEKDTVPVTKPILPNIPIRGIREQEEDLPAFTAYVDHNVEHLGINQPIKYDKVLVNIGSAYNVNTGIFTCPYDGLYVMNFVVSTNNIHQMVAKLVVDGVNQLDGISDTFHQYQEAQGGNFMVLSLKQGQSVWVAAYRWPDIYLDSTNSSRFSTFSGYMLRSL